MTQPDRNSAHDGHVGTKPLAAGESAITAPPDAGCSGNNGGRGETALGGRSIMRHWEEGDGGSGS